MSFTVKVKEELIATSHKDKSELAAIIKMSGNLGLASQGLTLAVTTENAKIARYIYAQIDELYKVKSDIRHHQKTNLKKNRVYTVFLDQQVEAILTDLHLADSFFGLETGISPEISSRDTTSQAYLRGSFLASGSVMNPEKGHYQLEIFSIYQDHAEDLAALMHHFLLDAKVLAHKGGAMTYLQKAEDIMDFFLVIGALEAKDEFERIKVLRQTRNEINRTNNVETANIARTVNASVKTINNIIKIMDHDAMIGLSRDLQEVAFLRINHPDYSIQQLADAMSQPITKSGVNHRLRKINKIADEL